jgi:hypothetical protein
MNHPLVGRLVYLLIAFLQVMLVMWIADVEFERAVTLMTLCHVAALVWKMDFPGDRK